MIADTSVNAPCKDAAGDPPAPGRTTGVGKRRLTSNALEVLRQRYLRKDDNGSIVESPAGLFRRVAHAVAEAEDAFPGGSWAQDAAGEFERIMAEGEFLPNSPTLMNAGTRLGQLSACFVLPVEDSIRGIFATLGHMAEIHKTGGGTGFDFSSLRPRGDNVAGTGGRASGPVSFMEVYDKATDAVVQGGKRRGANMGVLRCDHPDIMEFVRAKAEDGRLRNFNLSVGASDEFMRAVRENGRITLVNPRTRTGVGTVAARELFDAIVKAAWKTGDPGLLFLDTINRANPVPEAGRITATNPCGELPLLPWESCNLGSINVSAMTGPRGIDWEKLAKTVQLGVRFLDNVIEVNRYPLEQIARMARSHRKIGLGVMGFADLLVHLRIPYTAREAVELAGRLMRFIRRRSLQASRELARERGSFPAYPGSIHAEAGRPMRNATVNTVAPTGTISVIAGCSSGIEPLFALSFDRHVLAGRVLHEVNPAFAAEARKRGLLDNRLKERIAAKGSVADIPGIPDDMKEVYRTAFDVPPLQHLKIQAAFQKQTDNAVSKTINLPAGAGPDEVRDIYLRAYRLGCKGITLYRYGSRKRQVLSFAAAGAGDEEPNSESLAT